MHGIDQDLVSCVGSYLQNIYLGRRSASAGREAVIATMQRFLDVLEHRIGNDMLIEVTSLILQAFCYQEDFEERIASLVSELGGKRSHVRMLSSLAQYDVMTHGPQAGKILVWLANSQQRAASETPEALCGLSIDRERLELEKQQGMLELAVQRLELEKEKLDFARTKFDRDAEERRNTLTTEIIQRERDVSEREHGLVREERALAERERKLEEEEFEILNVGASRPSSAASNATSLSRKRPASAAIHRDDKRRRWAFQEEEFIVDLYNDRGECWAELEKMWQQDGRFVPRNQGQLKDKWRNLKHYGRVYFKEGIAYLLPSSV
ncbi:MAG: uncharacterized protein KVP18_001086 [Porospora cf. gigantea A]|uniref:uncharacterized protein n=2 Tax=Porospora cf. gigantea A TaxID=2853593 RepID=UPI0035593BA7|nr:MAG: hypothetical protein KVP18_001086 [Porospora cf. gigantea A]